MATYNSLSEINDELIKQFNHKKKVNKEATEKLYRFYEFVIYLIKCKLISIKYKDGEKIWFKNHYSHLGSPIDDNIINFYKKFVENENLYNIPLEKLRKKLRIHGSHIKKYSYNYNEIDIKWSPIYCKKTNLRVTEEIFKIIIKYLLNNSLNGICLKDACDYGYFNWLFKSKIKTLEITLSQRELLNQYYTNSIIPLIGYVYENDIKFIYCDDDILSIFDESIKLDDIELSTDLIQMLFKVHIKNYCIKGELFYNSIDVLKDYDERLYNYFLMNYDEYMNIFKTLKANCNV